MLIFANNTFLEFFFTSYFYLSSLARFIIFIRLNMDKIVLEMVLAKGEEFLVETRGVVSTHKIIGGSVGSIQTAQGVTGLKVRDKCGNIILRWKSEGSTELSFFAVVYDRDNGTSVLKVAPADSSSATAIAVDSKTPAKDTSTTGHRAELHATPSVRRVFPFPNLSKSNR